MPTSAIKLPKSVPTYIWAKGAKQGTIGYLRGNAVPTQYEGVLVMRTYTDIVALQDDNGFAQEGRFGANWETIPEGFEIEPLPKGTVITITI